MSRIDELIADLTPDGVAVKLLGEVGEFIRGNGLQKTDLADEGFPAIHYGQVHTHYGIWTESTKSFTDPTLAARLRRAKPGNLIIATTSEDDEAVAKATAWLGSEEVAVSGDAYIYRHNLDPRYVAYFFNSERFQEQKKRYITGTKVRRVSGDSLAKIRIPVPPPAVQREIVKMLDQLSQLEMKLEAELKAELRARNHQYEHYCTALLNSEICSSAPEFRIDQICNINRGIVISKGYLLEHPGPFPVYSSQTANEGIFGFIDTFAFDDEESISWTTDGANAGSVFYHQKKKFTITNVCGRLVVKDSNVLTRYLYFQLRYRAKAYVNEGMGNPKLMANHMGAVKVPVPPLDEQRRIISVLDKLDALVNGLGVSLPDELAARRKQYEHYRDRLLTFDELSIEEASA